MKTRSYSELMTIESFDDRVEYLKIAARVGEATFGGRRHLNQMLYHDPSWEETRRRVILRDSDGDMIYDLGHRDWPIYGGVYVHHINPITADDIMNHRPCVFDMENLIATSMDTHNAIHYGGASKSKRFAYEVRQPNDTSPWRK